MAIIWIEEQEAIIETAHPLPTVAPCGHCAGSGLVTHVCLGCDSPIAYYIDGHDVFVCAPCLVRYAKTH